MCGEMLGEQCIVASELYYALLRLKSISRSNNSNVDCPQPCGIKSLWTSMADSEAYVSKLWELKNYDYRFRRQNLTAEEAEVRRLLL